MRSYIFGIRVEPDQFEDGRPAFHAYCPALPGCHSWGHTYAEALARVQQAIELYVQDLLEAGEPVPADTELGIRELPHPAVAVNV